ncbi:calpain-A [Trichonephila clavipes]|nr:calpain-A [Trichonephila clavipes]
MGQSVVETQDDHPVEGLNGRPHRVLSSNHSTGEPVPLGYHYLRRLCRERGILFEDPEFHVSAAKIPITKHRSQSSITWMRPYELCARPKFISENTSRFDIEQGELGDYSLVAAVSCLTMTPRFLERVVPPDQNFHQAYCGIFRFRFWKFGDWVEVVVDDRLPTAKGRPLFLRSTDPTEFWPALLEKAYAKFYSGYSNLLGGRTSQTLQDMTGGVGQHFRISEHDPHVMFQTVNSSISRSTLLAASIRLEQRLPVRLRNGLVTQHAYSVTGLARVRTRTGEVPLIRLRNPWGKGEWNGPWSDRSWEWDSLPERDQELLSVRIRNDGEFWMSFEDFLRNFTFLDLLHVGPDDWMLEPALHSKRPWRAVLARRRWRVGFNAGGGPLCKDTTAMNPQFRVHIAKNGAKKCHVVVSILQYYTLGPQNAEQTKKSPLLPLGFTVYELSMRCTNEFERSQPKHSNKIDEIRCECKRITREYRTLRTITCGYFSVPNYRHGTNSGRWLGRRRPVASFPFSPDLNPLEFFWNYLKWLVYETPVATIADFMAGNVIASTSITRILDLLKHIRQSFVHQCPLCYDLCGRNLE